MKAKETNQSLKGRNPPKNSRNNSLLLLQQQVETYKRENDILLALSDDITTVRAKNDLIKLFSSRLKSYFEFTHAVISLIDEENKVYFPFLLDAETHPSKANPHFAEIIVKKYSLDDPFIKQVMASAEQIIIRLEDIIYEKHLPLYMCLQYESGIRYALVTPFRIQMKLMGFVFISSTLASAFTEDFKKILHGIAPQLSSAVSNIIKNEEIENKEKEKSFLLDFSSEIATVRTKEELASSVSAAVNKLNQKRGYVIRRINEDGATMSPYVFDLGEREANPKIINALMSSSYPINDGIQNRVLNSPIPVLLNVEKEIQRGTKAEYLIHWKRLGFEKLVAVRLRNGETNLGMLLIDIDEINVPLLQGICAQISIAMANIMANEQIVKKQAEQAFLIAFSHDITRVRTKQDLQDAISTVLNKTMNTQFVMIRVIEDDGAHLIPFMFDRTLFVKADAKIDFDKMSVDRISIEET